jgi:hypothetical protein
MGRAAISQAVVLHTIFSNNCYLSQIVSKGVNVEIGVLEAMDKC